MPTPWARYVKDITARAPQREIAAVTGIESSVLSRWLSGRMMRPRAEQVIQFARAYRRPPGEALTAAGYLEEGECGPAGSGARSLTELSNDELVAEIERFYVAAAAPIWELVSRFLGRHVEIEIKAPLPPHPGRRKIDPGRIGKISDAELMDATHELMNQRNYLMDEISRRLFDRNNDSK